MRSGAEDERGKRVHCVCALIVHVIRWRALRDAMRSQVSGDRDEAGGHAHVCSYGTSGHTDCVTVASRRFCARLVCSAVCASPMITGPTVPAKLWQIGSVLLTV